MISRGWSNTIPSFVQHFSGCFLIDTANNQNITVVVFIMCWHLWVKGKCHEWSHFYNAMLEMTTRQEMCKNVVQLCKSPPAYIVRCQTEQDNLEFPTSSLQLLFWFWFKPQIGSYLSIEKAQIILRRFLLLFPVFYRVPVFIVFISCMNLRNLHLYMLHHARAYIVYTCVRQ